MNSFKFEYHDRLAEKLNNPKTAAKTYWSILKTFVNGSKIPLMLPILVGNRLATDFLAKANLFNDFFNKQCSTIVNNSSLTTNQTFETENRLSTFDFSIGDVIKIIKALDPNKAHGHDGISIPMIKLCAFSISKPLDILFKNCLGNIVSPMNEKRQIVFLLTRKEISS